MKARARVCIASTIPVNNGNIRTFEIEGQPNPVTNASTNAPTNTPTTDILAVGPNYFDLVGSPAVSGRAFNDTDQLSSLPVAIVNQSFARHFFGDRNALGRHVAFGDHPKKLDMEIVGVVQDALYEGPREGVHRQHYPGEQRQHQDIRN